MPLLSRRRIIAAKIEAIEGTAEVLTATEAGILAMDVKADFDIKVTERSIALNTLSNLPPVMGGQSGKISFKAELKGNGLASYATIAPALGVYLKGCGFQETLSAASATYKPASTGVPSLTIWSYEDGIIKKLKGCRGNVKFEGKIGEPAYATFDFTGVWDDVIDGAMISPTFEGTVPPALLNAAFTVDSYAAVITSFSMDMGNKIDLRPTINNASGYVSALITERSPSGKIDPEMTLVGVYDWFGKWKGGAVAALSIGPVGGTAFNKYGLTAPKCVYKKVGSGDRAGNVTADVDFNMAMNTGDDELVLTFT
jgi:hypothetical protein